MMDSFSPTSKYKWISLYKMLLCPVSRDQLTLSNMKKSLKNAEALAYMELIPEQML